jgi:hypothetical protein
MAIKYEITIKASIANTADGRSLRYNQTPIATKIYSMITALLMIFSQKFQCFPTDQLALCIFQRLWFPCSFLTTSWAFA